MGSKIKDFLLGKDFKMDLLTTKYKIVWTGIFTITMISLFAVLGSYGAIGAGLYGGISVFVCRIAFHFIEKKYKRDMYYSQKK